MKKVLIADDSKFMRTLLKDKLRDTSFTIVAEANDGYEAIQMYDSYHPDIVILDITMPKIDGLTVLKEILSRNSKAKVVMCSAMGTKYNIEEAIKDGAIGFIIKPNFGSLLELLDKIINKQY